MRDLFRAEWTKIVGNRWVAGCLVWVFPVGALAFIIVAALILAAFPSARTTTGEQDALLWTDNTIGVWSFPNNPLGRLLLLGFTGVVFAGEYQWGTWKNIVPRNRRVSLILVKFVTLGTIVVLSFVLMSIIWGVGWGFLMRIAGASYGPAVTSKVLTDFAGDYLLAMALAFTATIIAAGYAALAGMLTRSILGGVMVGLGVTIAESVSVFVLMIIGHFLDIPRIVNLYRLTPGYNLTNVSSWINNNVANRVEVPVTTAHKVILSDGLPFSVVVLALWVIGLIMLTTVLFNRQDITG
jgi:hypothetical protein